MLQGGLLNRVPPEAESAQTKGATGQVAPLTHWGCSQNKPIVGESGYLPQYT